MSYLLLITLAIISLGFGYVMGYINGRKVGVMVTTQYFQSNYRLIRDPR